jgi:NADPH:quinone reductase-like Zn-dependent oxidoreductase
MGLTSFFTRQKLRPLLTTPNSKDLLVLKGLVEAGQLKPVIERRYPLTAVAEALRHVGKRRAQGQTVIQVAS